MTNQLTLADITNLAPLCAAKKLPIIHIPIKSKTTVDQAMFYCPYIPKFVFNDNGQMVG